MRSPALAATFCPADCARPARLRQSALRERYRRGENHAAKLDPLTKEMIYLAVSVTNGCPYCIASHSAAARKAGMSDAMFGELMAVVGMANETNRLANGYRVPIDRPFE
jgi:AhpD family alkylhydroperoxidase